MRSEGATEIFRFIVTGVVSNALGYGMFLIAVNILGIGHKTAVTVLFAIVMAINFTVNRKWTFKSNGAYSQALLKFVIVYLAGYGMNILILATFVDYLSYSASWVQLATTVLLPIYYFLANKFFVHGTQR